MNDQTQTSEIQERLGVARGRRGGRVARALLWLVIVGGVITAVAAWRAGAAEPPAQYQTATVEKGTLTVTITATGEVQSLTQVNIGTEISGVVESVNVDFNSPVVVGQVLARVNTEK